MQSHSTEGSWKWHGCLGFMQNLVFKQCFSETAWALLTTIIPPTDFLPRRQRNPRKGTHESLACSRKKLYLKNQLCVNQPSVLGCGDLWAYSLYYNPITWKGRQRTRSSRSSSTPYGLRPIWYIPQKIKIKTLPHNNCFKSYLPKNNHEFWFLLSLVLWRISLSG